MIQIQGIDGMFYINPKFAGEQYLFVCSDDGLTLYVQKTDKSTLASAKARGYRFLKSKDLKTKLKDMGILHCVFDSKIRLSYAFEVTLKEPIPVPDRWDEALYSPDSSHKFLAWSIVCDEDDEAAIFSDSDRMNPILVKFLTDSIFTKDRKMVRRKFKKAVKDGKIEVRQRSNG